MVSLSVTADELIFVARGFVQDHTSVPRSTISAQCKKQQFTVNKASLLYKVK